MTTITLHAGDNRIALRAMIERGELVDSVVSDPPYGLVSTVKRFGKAGAAEAKSNGATGVFKRASGGFMGQEWDASGIERDPEFWSLIFQVLKPGGYVLAFSSPRTGHWQACAMETAGFIMHPFLGWAYGSGMPKGHKFAPGAADGWQYGAQALKPALEPIYVGQKPFSEKNGTLNWQVHGVGGINIDGCRVGTTGGGTSCNNRDENGKCRGHMNAGRSTSGETFHGPDSDGGRHPANLLHDGSADVVAMFPLSAGQRAAVTGDEPSASTKHCYNTFGDRVPATPRGDSGSAARFFNSFPDGEFPAADRIFPTAPDSWQGGTQQEHCESGELTCDPIFYHSKATKADRAGSKHPTVKPVTLMRWLCRLVTPPGGTVLDPFAGSGTTGAAAQLEGFNCVLMEGHPQFIVDIQTRFSLLDEGPDFDEMFDGMADFRGCDEFAALIG